MTDRVTTINQLIGHIENKDINFNKTKFGINKLKILIINEFQYIDLKLKMQLSNFMEGIY